MPKTLSPEQLAEKRKKHAAYMKAWYAKRGRKRNRAQENAYARAYAKANPEKVKASLAAWRATHVEEERQYKSDYHQKNYATWRQRKLAEDPDYFKKRRAKAVASPTHMDVQTCGHLRRTYGITLAEFKAMSAAQGGVCAICEKAETKMHRGKVQRLSVDHDHETGKVRGLLCHACNKLAGSSREYVKHLERVIAYIQGSA